MNKKVRSRIVSWSLSLALVFSSFMGTGSLIVAKADVNTPVQTKTFDLIEITDFHGQLFDNNNTVELGAILAKQVKDVEAANPNDTIVVGGGDLYQGTPISNVLQGVTCPAGYDKPGNGYYSGWKPRVRLGY